MNGLLEYWPILAFGAVNIFGIGVMWWKVESARAAVKLLFQKVDKLEEHNARHCAELERYQADLLKIDKESLDHRKEASNRYAALVIRVDQIYSILTNGK